MAFCGSCGNKLEGNERFCVNCGRDVSANAGTTAATGVASASTTTIPPAAPVFQPVQPVTAMPGGFPQGAIPIVMTAPPQAQAKRGGRWGTFLVIALALGGGYYFYSTHKPAPAPPAPSNSAVAKQEAFDAHWQTVNGFIQISSGKWTNNSTVPVQSATLECAQYDASGTELDQMRTTLNGPTQPGGSITFNPFWMGAVASNLNRVTCTIVHVEQTAKQSQ
jgi:hypothetical protein